jgi:hypothetical protein
VVPPFSGDAVRNASGRPVRVQFNGRGVRRKTLQDFQQSHALAGARINGKEWGLSRKKAPNVACLLYG